MNTIVKCDISITINVHAPPTALSVQKGIDIQRSVNVTCRTAGIWEELSLSLEILADGGI